MEASWFLDMGEAPSVVITSLGFCTPLGTDPVTAVARDESAVREQDALSGLLHQTAAVVEKIDLRGVLKRRKDRKLMARPSQLALAAAAEALRSWPGSTNTLGLFVGVGREPGDDGESENALVAAQVDGRVSEAAVAGPCRDLYPPLLPLKTLPNMALARVNPSRYSGENGTWCGGPAAGLTALRAAIWALEAGRCDAALVVGADSWTSAGAVRDLLRIADGAPIQPPGEAGVALLLERAGETIGPSYAEVRLTQEHGPVSVYGHHRVLGDCKAADALLALGLRVGGGPGRAQFVAAEEGQSAVGVDLFITPEFACYPAHSMDVGDA